MGGVIIMGILLRIPRTELKELNVFTRVGLSTLLFTLMILLPTEVARAERRIKIMPTLIEDWKLVVATIIQEAAYESIRGKVMVAEVIRNRTENRYNSKTLSI
jgi:hypothetical protein